MRLALIIYGQPDQISGGYLYDRQLARAWKEQGHDVQFISLPPAGYGPSLLHNFDRGWRDRLASLEVDVLIQDELCHPSLFSLNRQIRSLANYRIVSLVHHLRSSEDHPAHLMWGYRLIERSYLKSVDNFIFNSHPTQASVEQLLGHPISGVVASPGRDHLTVEESWDSNQLPKKNDRLDILFVGNLIRRKGLHWLLEALSGLENEPWKLEIVGRHDVESDYSQFIQNQIARRPFADRVIFHGPIQKQQLGRIYKQADLLAVPSVHEGFGLVYLEAMGFGLPVLASASGGASDLVTPGKNGFLIEPGDVLELRRRLQDYLSDRRLLATHSRAAQARFEQQPTWAETAKNVVEYLEGGRPRGD